MIPLLVAASPFSVAQDSLPESAFLTLFLCGDVMTGRGIDQILPHPSDPRLHEPLVKDARDYVRLAERSSGSISRPVSFFYVWGEALAELERWKPDLRLVNLETSITTSEEYWPGKGINYRMHPDNLPCLTAAKVDFCCLANNHILDWGYGGLAQTVQTLTRAGIAFAGAGQSLAQARQPAAMEVKAKGRVVLFALGSTSGGVPLAWAAGEERPGVDLLREPSEAAIRDLSERLRRLKRPGDLLVCSIHWGGNWGYEVPASHRRFAHRLIEEAGVDLVWGHSSHHPRPIEVHDGRLILYGCGDFINDYEGIGGYEEFRPDLALMYLPRIDPATGRLIDLAMTPFQIRRLRLQRAGRADAAWLRDTLNRRSSAFGTRIVLGEDDRLYLR